MLLERSTVSIFCVTTLAQCKSSCPKVSEGDLTTGVLFTFQKLSRHESYKPVSVWRRITEEQRWLFPQSLTMIGGYTGAWTAKQATKLPAYGLRPAHNNHPSTTLRSARDVASQTLPFLACNIRNWEWPRNEASYNYSQMSTAITVFMKKAHWRWSLY